MEEKMINNKKIIIDVSIFILIKYIFLNEISIFEVIFMGFPISVVLVLRENLSHRNTQWISVRNYGFLFEIILIYFFCYNSIIFDWFWLKPLINYFVKFSLATAWSSADIGRTPECCSTPVDFKRPDDYETCSCLYDLNLSLVIFKYSRSAFFCFCLTQDMDLFMLIH